MKNYYRVSEAASVLGVSPSTVRRWEDEGLLESQRTLRGNHRTYSRVEVDRLAGKAPEAQRMVFYVRSSNGQEASLQTQVEQLTQAYGEPSKIYTDRASGLNEKRAGLQSLLNKAEKGELSHVMITHKDRLTRFGYSYLERLLKAYGTELIVLHEKKHLSPHEELMQDFMSLLASFSGKFYRLRGHAQQKALLDNAKERLT